MSDPVLSSFSESEEQQLQKVHDELLSKAKDKVVVLPESPPEDPVVQTRAQVQHQRLWWLAVKKSKGSRLEHPFPGVAGRRRYLATQHTD